MRARTQRRALAVTAVTAVAALAGAAAVLASGGPDAAGASEEIVLELEPGEVLVDLVVSGDARHWLAVTTMDPVGPATGGGSGDVLGPRRVHHDGAFLGLFRHVPRERVRFSPDGTRVAFVSVSWGKKGFGKYQVHVGADPVGVPGHYAGEVEMGPDLGPWWSPDSGSLAWLGAWKQRQFPVVDGSYRLADRHDEVSMPAPWTPDGRLVWVARDDGASSLVLDGTVVETAEAIRVVHPRPASSREAVTVATVQVREDGTHLVLDGVAGEGWADIRDVRTSADGDHWAYHGIDGEGRSFLVLDGSAEGPWLDLGGIEMSGARAAYSARSDEGWHAAVAGGPVSRPWQVIEQVAVLPDGRALAVARDGARRFLLGAGGDGWREVSAFQHVERVLSGPGGRMGLVVVEAGEARLFLDDALVGPGGDEIRPCTVTFDEDGSVAAWVVRRSGEDHLVVDGEVLGSWRDVACPLAIDGDLLRLFARDDGRILRVTIPL